MKREVSHLRNVFTEINKYPKSVFENSLKTIKSKIQEGERVQETDANPSEDLPQQQDNAVTVHPFITLPYNGASGENLVGKLKKCLHKVLPANVIPRFTYKGKKLGSYFSIKDRVADKHNFNIVYAYYPSDTENKTCEYVGETSVRHETRMDEHIRKDKNSSIYKNSLSTGREVNYSDFNILAKGYDKKVDRRICEALFIKDLKPVLNEQVISFKLVLFN